jgi:hypothetical protein
VNNELLLWIGIVAGALALVLLIVRPRRRAPLTLGLTHAPPRRLAVRASSLSRHIDEAFDALEIKPVRLPSIDIAFDDTPLPPPRRTAHSMFDTSDAPLDAPEFPIEHTMYEAAAFGAEPTVTVVDDDDGTSPVEELAAFLARGSRPPVDTRARTILGVAMPQRRRGDRRASTPS